MSDAKPRKLDLTPDDHHYVCLVSGALKWDLILLLGDGNIVPSGGTATYSEVEAPDDRTISDFTGANLWRMDVPIMLDAWIEDINPPDADRTKKPPRFRNIQNPKKRHRRREEWRRKRNRDAPTNVSSYVELLLSLAMPDHKDEPPPSVRLYGKGVVPQSLNGELWVVEDIEWGDKEVSPNRGVLRRQALTLKLLEENRGDKLKTRHRRQHHGRGPQQYTVKKGDTLQAIAAHFYGDATQWHVIAEANKIKNPRQLDKYVGTKIKIPRDPDAGN